MSLFQCDRCGCLENTSCTGGYWTMKLVEDYPEVAASYRKVLGLAPDEPFGAYCSVCDPAWFDARGHYGIGPRPKQYKDSMGIGDGEGKWHGKFERIFLPKGKFHTNDDGNLAHIETLDTDIDKYVLPEEDLSVHHTLHSNDWLPNKRTT